MPTIRPPAVAGLFYPAEPTHRVAVRGLALPGADAFDTPLGRVITGYGSNRQPQPSGASQRQRARARSTTALFANLPDFRLLPLAVGMATAEEIAEVLETLWGGEEMLIAISSRNLAKHSGRDASLSSWRGTMTGKQLLRAHSPF